jgi:hypothetical protein
MRRFGIVIVITAAVAAYACGSDNNTAKDARIDTGSAQADAPADAHHDAQFPDGPTNVVAFTLMNYAGGCTISIGSGAFSQASARTDYVGAGVLTLTAEPNVNYTLGSDMWHHTDGDPGYGSGGSGSGTPTIGEAGSQTAGSAGSGSGSGTPAMSVAHATVALGTPKCVWVCCPFTGNICTGLPEQCP